MFMKFFLQPAINQTLEKQLAYHFFDKNFLKQSPIKPDIVVSYFLGLQSYHVDHDILLIVFNNSYLVLIMKRGRRLFLNIKTKKLPITKIIFKKITL